MRIKYLIAEYCPGPFYWGWWMYLRDHNDGRENDDGWGWLKRAEPWDDLAILIKTCIPADPAPPAITRSTTVFAEWFAATYPCGLLIEVLKGKQNFRLAEVLTHRPAPRHYCIRTIQGAVVANKITDQIEREVQLAKCNLFNPTPKPAEVQPGLFE